jgi:hypothetical protein
VAKWTFASRAEDSGSNTARVLRQKHSRAVVCVLTSEMKALATK